MHYHPSNTLQTTMVDDKTFLQSFFYVDTLLTGSEIFWLAFSRKGIDEYAGYMAHFLDGI